jgi:hypothetical protein
MGLFIAKEDFGNGITYHYADAENQAHWARQW